MGELNGLILQANNPVLILLLALDRYFDTNQSRMYSPKKATHLALNDGVHDVTVVWDLHECTGRAAGIFLNSLVFIGHVPDQNHVVIPGTFFSDIGW